MAQTRLGEKPDLHEIALIPSHRFLCHSNLFNSIHRKSNLVFKLKARLLSPDANWIEMRKTSAVICIPLQMCVQHFVYQFAMNRLLKFGWLRNKDPSTNWPNRKVRL